MALVHFRVTSHLGKVKFCMPHAQTTGRHSTKLWGAVTCRNCRRMKKAQNARAVKKKNTFCSGLLHDRGRSDPVWEARFYPALSEY